MQNLSYLSSAVGFLKPPEVAFVTSGRLGEVCDRIRTDPDYALQFDLALLAGVALDPERGASVADFTRRRGDSQHFSLNLNRLANPIRLLVELPCGSAQAEALTEAVHENLVSERFRAAVELRRLAASVRAQRLNAPKDGMRATPHAPGLSGRLNGLDAERVALCRVANPAEFDEHGRAMSYSQFVASLVRRVADEIEQHQEVTLDHEMPRQRM